MLTRLFACPGFGLASVVASAGAADTDETAGEPAAAGAGRPGAPQAEQNLASPANSRPQWVQKGIAATSRLPHTSPTWLETASLSADDDDRIARISELHAGRPRLSIGKSGSRRSVRCQTQACPGHAASPDAGGRRVRATSPHRALRSRAASGRTADGRQDRIHHITDLGAGRRTSGRPCRRFRWSARGGPWRSGSSPGWPSLIAR